jgi:hypothetical protein
MLSVASIILYIVFQTIPLGRKHLQKIADFSAAVCTAPTNPFLF